MTNLTFDNNQTVNETLSGVSYQIAEHYDRTLPGLPDVNLHLTFPIPTVGIVMTGGWADNQWGDASTLNVTFNNSLVLSGLNISDSNVTLSGKTVFNSSDNYAFNGKIKIDANLVGASTWDLYFGSTTLNDSVTGGTFDLGVNSNLIIERPSQFNASIVDENLNVGTVTLADLTATSYSYANGIMTFFNGNRPVDTLRFSEGPYNQAAFGAYHTAGGVVVSEQAPAGGIALPVHGAGV